MKMLDPACTVKMPKVLLFIFMLTLAVSCSSDNTAKTAARLSSRFDVSVVPLAEIQRIPGEELFNRISGILTILSEYGLNLELAPLLILDSDRDILGWQVTSGWPEAVKKELYWSFDAFSRETDKLEKNQTAYTVQTTLHLSSKFSEQSPLVPSAASWDDTKLTLWLVREGIRALPANRVSMPDQTDYLALRAAELVLIIKNQETELQRLKEDLHDKSTWASLVTDLKNQLASLPENTPPEERVKVIRTWREEYIFNYPSRFLSNRYRDFAAEGIDPLELASLDLSPSRWPEYSARYKDAGGTLKDYAEYVFGPDNK